MYTYCKKGASLSINYFKIKIFVGKKAAIRFNQINLGKWQKHRELKEVSAFPAGDDRAVGNKQS